MTVQAEAEDTPERTPATLLGRLVASFDARVEALVAPWRGRPAADRLFYTASSLGEFSLIWVALALARGLRGGRPNGRAAWRAVVGAVVESLLVNAGLKSVFRRRRPVEQVTHPLPFRQPLTSSFPSGHATAAFCGAMLLAEGDPLGPLYFLGATVVATSRVYARIHHASDVVGGVVVGLALGQLGRAVVPLEPRR